MAQITVPQGANCKWIAAQAGSTEIPTLARTNGIYILTVEDVSQAALEAAYALYDNDTHNAYINRQLPNWTEFRRSLMTSNAWRRISNASNMGLIAMITTLAWKLNDESYLEDFIMTWNEIKGMAPPNPAEITELNNIVTSNHLPFSLSANGDIVIEE